MSKSPHWRAQPGRTGLIVLALAHTGLRFGELAALRVARVDLMRVAWRSPSL